LLAEDFLINKALALSQISELALSTEEISKPDNVDTSTVNISDTLLDAIISSGKRFSIALNGVNSSNNIESEEQLINRRSIEHSFLQKVDDVQSGVVSSSGT
ncbi:unnamed protein product, partial [Rotaria sp. Silwood2]